MGRWLYFPALLSEPALIIEVRLAINQSFSGPDNGTETPGSMSASLSWTPTPPANIISRTTTISNNTNGSISNDSDFVIATSGSYDGVGGISFTAFQDSALPTVLTTLNATLTYSMARASREGFSTLVYANSSVSARIRYKQPDGTILSEKLRSAGFFQGDATGPNQSDSISFSVDPSPRFQ